MIFIESVIVFLILTVILTIAKYIRSHIYQDVTKKKQHLDELINNQNMIIENHKKNVEKNVRDEHNNEYQRLKQYEKNLVKRESDSIKRRKESIEILEEAQRLKEEAQRSKKETELKIRQHERNDRSQLAQRDRLREQKQLLIKYLESMPWVYNDGSKITYSSLIKLAKNYFSETKGH